MKSVAGFRTNYVSYYALTVGKAAISVAFVRPSVRPSRT